MSNEKTGRRGKKRIWGKDDTELSLLALPTTIWYLLFCFLPMFGIIIAFKNYKVYGGFLTSFIKSEWVGFNNFKFLFSSKDIWLILRNTLGYNVIFIILGIVAPVAAAIAVGQLHSKKLAKAYQTAMFMPYFLSWVVVSALVWAFLSYDKGLINGMLESWGMDRQQWYMKPAMWPPFLVFMNLWKGLGYGMVVYLATITGIDKTYYEAAGIDGSYDLAADPLHHSASDEDRYHHDVYHGSRTYFLLRLRSVLSGAQRFQYAVQLCIYSGCICLQTVENFDHRYGVRCGLCTVCCRMYYDSDGECDRS